MKIRIHFSNHPGELDYIVRMVAGEECADLALKRQERQDLEDRIVRETFETLKTWFQIGPETARGVFEIDTCKKTCVVRPEPSGDTSDGSFRST